MSVAPGAGDLGSSLPDAAALGFVGDELAGWHRFVRGREVRFQILRTLGELEEAERLQTEVFGVSERDLIPANELIVVAETGGAVIAAYLSEQGQRAAGALVGWGGFVGRPRIVSDFLAVRPDARNFGLAAELKRLQAAIALARGFTEIVWTVDPLRAANARLNFGKLGAMADGYEIDRYGSSFATGLYGGIPSDRLHVTWQITSPSVIARLLGTFDTLPAQPTVIPLYRPGTEQGIACVEIPADIDSLLADNPKQAYDWRSRVRVALLSAFAEELIITGFEPATPGRQPSLVLERRDSAAP